MEFTTVPMRWSSPFAGQPSMVRAIFWLRSPSATAEITGATSLVGRTRSSTSELTASTAVPHAPSAKPSRTRSVIRPSRPTTRATRWSFPEMPEFSSTNSFKALAMSPAIPRWLR
jgi:hypothetical protein